jgi:hypothetical protein
MQILFSLLHNILSRNGTRYNIFEYINISVTQSGFSFIFCKELFAAPIIELYLVTYFPCIRALFSDNTIIMDLFRVLSEFTHKMPLSY